MIPWPSWPWTWLLDAKNGPCAQAWAKQSAWAQCVNEQKTSKSSKCLLSQVRFFHSALVRVASHPQTRSMTVFHNRRGCWNLLGSRTKDLTLKLRLCGNLCFAGNPRGTRRPSLKQGEMPGRVPKIKDIFSQNLNVWEVNCSVEGWGSRAWGCVWWLFRNLEVLWQEDRDRRGGGERRLRVKDRSCPFIQLSVRAEADRPADVLQRVHHGFCVISLNTPLISPRHAHNTTSTNTDAARPQTANFFYFFYFFFLLHLFSVPLCVCCDLTHLLPFLFYRASDAAMAELEDLEFGKSDFVLLDEVTMEQFLDNLKLR